MNPTFFKQSDRSSCGVCAVNSILKMYGKPGIVFSTPKGVSPEQISKTLKQQGIATKVVKKADISQLKPRSIVYYPAEDHYVALEQVSGTRVLVNDSLKGGPEWVDAEALERKAKEGDESGIGWVMETSLKI